MVVIHFLKMGTVLFKLLSQLCLKDNSVIFSLDKSFSPPRIQQSWAETSMEEKSAHADANVMRIVRGRKKKELLVLI